MDEQSVSVTFDPLAQPRGDLHINFAWLEFDKTSNVRAGENRGKSLSNDFIVGDWRRVDLKLVDGAYATMWWR